MPLAVTDDGVHLYCEETGSGTPLIFHSIEYAGATPQLAAGAPLRPAVSRHYLQRAGLSAATSWRGGPFFAPLLPRDARLDDGEAIGHVMTALT